MLTLEQVAKIESAIEKKAEEIAYNQTNHYSDRLMQSTMYELTKNHIILGARLFQEELSNIKEI